MNILVIDGQGGQLGCQIIKAIVAKHPEADVMAVGTNAVATAAKIKGGAKKAATGENPVIVACRRAEVINGPVGIVIAVSLFGEITPVIAVAVGQSEATRILIPVNRCENLIAGVPNLTVSALVEDALIKLEKIIDKRS